jgi:hypothetical protein
MYSKARGWQQQQHSLHCLKKAVFCIDASNNTKAQYTDNENQ